MTGEFYGTFELYFTQWKPCQLPHLSCKKKKKGMLNRFYAWRLIFVFLGFGCENAPLCSINTFLFQVGSIVKSFRWAPFLPVAPDSSMLSVLLLLSKYRLRNIPVIEVGKPTIKNFITQSAVVKGLESCKGRDWFDCIAAHPISDLGLPFMSYNEV